MELEIGEYGVYKVEDETGLENDVEGRIRVAGADARHPEGPAFDASQKAVERSCSVQRDMALA